MTPAEMLKLYEAVWGPLNERQQTAFLTHHLVADLAGLQDVFVDIAIRRHRALQRIVGEARRRQRAAGSPIDRQLAARPKAGSSAAPTRTKSEHRPQWRCDYCRRVWGGTVTATSPKCFRCNDTEGVHLLCPCGKSGLASLHGWCRRCHDARRMASRLAGPGAQGPPGVTAKDPYRRRPRWRDQSTEGP